MEKIGKKFKQGLIKKTGRNNKGRITSYHLGGGKKLKKQMVNREVLVLGIPYKVLSIYKLRGITSLLGKVCYSNGLITIISINSGVRVGDILISSDGINYSHLIYDNGSNFKLSSIGVGKKVSNLERCRYSGSVYARSAGSFGVVMKCIKFLGGYIVKMRSGKLKFFYDNTFVSLGVVSNVFSKYKILYKAGQNRWLGRRPIVRGVAKNPVDHPHGGGEGKTSGGRCSVTPWGVLTKGYKTVKKKNKVLKI